MVIVGGADYWTEMSRIARTKEKKLLDFARSRVKDEVRLYRWQMVIGKQYQKTISPMWTQFQKTTKDKARVKLLTGSFKAMKNIGIGAATGIFKFMEGMGALDPVFELINGLIEIMSGKIMAKLSPAFSSLFSILSDESVLSAMDGVATFISAILVPSFQGLSGIMTLLGPAISSVGIGFSIWGEYIAWWTDLLGITTGAWDEANLATKRLMHAQGAYVSGLHKELNLKLRLEGQKEIKEQMMSAGMSVFEQVGGMTTGRIGDRISGTDIAVMQTAEGLEIKLEGMGAGRIMMQGGGIVTRGPVNATLHANELVAPLEELPRILSSLNVGGGGGINVYIDGNVYNEDIIDMMIEKLESRRALGII